MIGHTGWTYEQFDEADAARVLHSLDLHNQLGRGRIARMKADAAMRRASMGR